MAHLMKFHLLQWEVVKLKFLMNSSKTLTVLNLHQKTDPKVQQILKVKVTTKRSKVKSRSHHDAAHLQPKPGQDFIGQGHYGKVKGQIKVRP